MKRFFYYLLFLVLASSCGEDSVVEPLDHTPNTNPNPSVADLARKNAPEVRSIDIYNEVGAHIYGPYGTQIIFPPYTYGPVKGTISLKLIEIYNKRNMIGGGIYTETQDGRMLNSQGMFRVIGYKDGAVILPQKDAVITMPLAPGSTQANTKVFELIEAIDPNTGEMRGLWKEYSENWTSDSSSQGRCKFNFNLLNWCNLDAYIDAGTNNRITVSVPSGFTSKNTTVYFNLDGVNGVTALSVDPVNKKFFTMSIKQGLTGTLVIVGLKDNIYYKKVVPITFTGQEQNLSFETLEPSNKAGIEALLAGM